MNGTHYLKSRAAMITTQCTLSKLIPLALGLAALRAAGLSLQAQNTGDHSICRSANLTGTVRPPLALTAGARLVAPVPGP